MKDVFIKSLMKKLEETKKYNAIELEKIKYGLESIYLTITKLIIILLVSYYLDCLRESVIFLLFYNAIRATSFGLHASKSWICLLSSLIIFVVIPIICNYIIIPFNFKILLGIILTLWFYKYSPADTKKRPIINKNRRTIYKIISVFIVILFTVSSLMINNNFVSNCLLISLIIQAFIISPYIYTLFNFPYNNYKNYLENQV